MSKQRDDAPKTLMPEMAAFVGWVCWSLGIPPHGLIAQLEDHYILPMINFALNHLRGRSAVDENTVVRASDE